MRTILILGLMTILVATILVACQRTPGTSGDADTSSTTQPGVTDGGAQVEPGDDKPQKAEGELKDGNKHGPWVYWHENGQKAAEGRYADGNKHGPWTYWYGGGQKAAAGEYTNGKKHGRWTEWEENGQKATERRYNDGMEIFQ